ncbi:hypothetical protein [Helicobacter colisuis]|uniref:Alpha-2,3-sialyltransferase n=1 Tax=Helicobacter colisuis TaxID=2949739 RepID=A0ABT0TWT1_9HELI|nr:hypothetical protein [Helicobacter colisuis]MCL9819837.1 hypothetical protein [Helicobacter colisuis]
MIETKISSVGGGANNSASLKKNIVLLGGSNSVMVNGLQKGIREGIAKLNENRKEEEKLEFYNFALGSSISLQNLYELLRERNSSILQNTDLIITESNINEIANHHAYSRIPLEKIFASIEWFYGTLYNLQKRVVVLLLPLFGYPNEIAINNAHRICANRYGFNLVDMQKIYTQDNLWDFYKYWGFHQMARLMSAMGENIIKSFNDFQKTKTIEFFPKLPKFEIVSPKQMILSSENIETKTLKNSAFCEEIYRIRSGVCLQFPTEYKGFHLLGIHAWNEGKPEVGSVYNSYSSIIVSNSKQNLIKASSLIRLFNTINANFIVDDNTSVCFNELNHPATEGSEAVIPNQHTKILDYFDLVDFLLASGGEWHYPMPDNHETIEIESKYNFNHLIPDVKLYKEIIDEYCARMDPIKLAPLQTQLQQKDQIIQAKTQELESKTQELTSKTQQLTQTKNQLDSTKQQLDSKVKELTSKTKELSSLPIKKQTLEIKNLEQDNLLKQIQIQEAKQDLINKQLHTKKLEKELGYEANVLQELELKNQELTQTKNQLDFTKKQLESKNKILSSNPNTSHLIQNTSCFKGKLAYLNTLATAKDRIHNHLSYKLGQAMIENSKSLLGYIRMPYVLSYIKDKHKQEQQQYQEAIKKNPNLKLPTLESYPDYKESLKEKECLTYKLGEAFMKANKTWYKGGYVKLWFEVRKLRGERK